METITTTRRLIVDAWTALLGTGMTDVNRMIDQLQEACDWAELDTEFDLDPDAANADDPLTLDLPEGVRHGILRETHVNLSR